MLRNNILNNNITMCSCCCHHKCSSLDLIRNNRISTSVKSLNAFDTDYISSCTFNVSTHRIKEIRYINYMRFLSRIFQNSVSLCHT